MGYSGLQWQTTTKICALLFILKKTMHYSTMYKGMAIRIRALCLQTTVPSSFKCKIPIENLASIKQFILKPLQSIAIRTQLDLHNILWKSCLISFEYNVRINKQILYSKETHKRKLNVCRFIFSSWHLDISREKIINSNAWTIKWPLLLLLLNVLHVLTSILTLFHFHNVTIFILSFFNQIRFSKLTCAAYIVECWLWIKHAR